MSSLGRGVIREFLQRALDKSVTVKIARPGARRSACLDSRATEKSRLRLTIWVRHALALAIIFASICAPILNTEAAAANGSAVYTYDALGRVASVSYDTGIIVIYTYDANGNRLTQVINVNTKPLCLGTSAHGNPTTWGAGLWATAASGC